MTKVRRFGSTMPIIFSSCPAAQLSFQSLTATCYTDLDNNSMVYSSCGLVTYARAKEILTSLMPSEAQTFVRRTNISKEHVSQVYRPLNRPQSFDRKCQTQMDTLNLFPMKIILKITVAIETEPRFLSVKLVFDCRCSGILTDLHTETIASVCTRFYTGIHHKTSC